MVPGAMVPEFLASAAATVNIEIHLGLHQSDESHGLDTTGALRSALAAFTDGHGTRASHHIFLSQLMSQLVQNYPILPKPDPPRAMPRAHVTN